MHCSNFLALEKFYTVPPNNSYFFVKKVPTAQLELNYAEHSIKHIKQLLYLASMLHITAQTQM